MRNTVKRSLALLLTIVMVMGLVVVPASAARPMGDVAVESAGGDKPAVSSGSGKTYRDEAKAELSATAPTTPDAGDASAGRYVLDANSFTAIPAEERIGAAEEKSSKALGTSNYFTLKVRGGTSYIGMEVGDDDAQANAATVFDDGYATSNAINFGGNTNKEDENTVLFTVTEGKKAVVKIWWSNRNAAARSVKVWENYSTFSTSAWAFAAPTIAKPENGQATAITTFILPNGGKCAVGCRDGVTIIHKIEVQEVDAVTPVTAIAVADGDGETSAELTVGTEQTINLTATTTPASPTIDTIEWSSNNEKVTVTSAGVVTVAADATHGTATITATNPVPKDKDGACVTGTYTITLKANHTHASEVPSDPENLGDHWSVKSTTPATCVATGKVVVECDVDGCPGEEIILPTTSHNYVDCICSVCSAVDETSERVYYQVADKSKMSDYTGYFAGMEGVKLNAKSATTSFNGHDMTLAVQLSSDDYMVFEAKKSGTLVMYMVQESISVKYATNADKDTVKAATQYTTAETTNHIVVIEDIPAGFVKLARGASSTTQFSYIAFIEDEVAAPSAADEALADLLNPSSGTIELPTGGSAADKDHINFPAAPADKQPSDFEAAANIAANSNFLKNIVKAALEAIFGSGYTVTVKTASWTANSLLAAGDKLGDIAYTADVTATADNSTVEIGGKVEVKEAAAASVTSQPATGVGVWNFAEKDQIGYDLITGAAASQPTKDYGITVAVDGNEATITVDEAAALAAWADSTKGARMNSYRMVNTVGGAKYLFVCVFTEIPIEGFSKSSGHKLVIGDGTFAENAIALTGAQGTDIDVVTDGTKWYMGQWFGMLQIDEANNTLVILNSKDFEKTYNFYDSTGNLLATRELTVKRVTQKAQSDTHEYALTVGAESATLKLGVAEFEAIDFTATDAVNGGQATAVIPTAVSADENKVGVRVAAADGDSNNKSIVVWAKAATTTPVNVTVTNGDQTKTIAVTVVASDATTGYTLPTTWDLKTAGLLYSVDKYTNGSSYAAAKYKGLIIDGKGSCQFKHDENGLVFHSAGTLSIPVDGASKITVKGSGNATMADSDKATTTALNSTGVEFNYTGTGPAVLTLAANAKVTDIAVEAVQAPAVEPENATGLGVWSKLAGNIAVSSAYESNSANLEDKTGISFTTNNGVQIKVDETKLRAAYAEPAKAAVINQAGAPMRHGNTLYVAVLSEIPEAVLAVTGWQLVVKVGETRYPTNDSEYATTPSALGIDTATDGAKTYLADWYAVGTCDGSAVGVLAKAAETHETITYEYYGAGATPELLAIRTLALDVDTVLTGAEIPGTVTATDCTDGNNGTIAGLTTDMEVKGPGAEDYTPVAAAGTMSNLAKGTYLVRYAAKAATAEAQAKAAGEPKALTIKGAMTVAVTAPSKVYDGTAIDAVTYTVTDGNANVTTTSVKYAVTANASTQPADNAYVTTVAELDLKAVADTGKEIWVKAEAEGYNAAVGHAAVTITKAAAPTLTIAASSTSVRADETNGATVTLSVTSSVPACVPTVECDKTLTAPSGLTDNHNGTWTAKLPNATETYVFTVKYEATANYNAATSKDVTVKVTKADEAMASPIDLKVMTQAHYDEDFSTWVGGPNTANGGLALIHGNDLAVNTSGVVTGSLKFLSGFEGFNASTPAEQQGFYLAVEIPAPDGWASSNTSVNIKTTNPCSAGAPKDATFASNLFAAPGSALTVLFYLDPTVLATAEHAPTITVDWGNGADNDLWLPNSVELDLDGVTFEPTVKQAQILFVDDAASYQAAFGTTMPTDHNLQLPWIVVKYNRTVAGEVAVEIKKGGNAVALVGATTAPGAADNANAYFSYHMVSQADTDHSGQDYINQAVAAGEYTATVTQHGTTATAVAATYNKYPVTVADVEGATVALSATAPANQNLLVAKDTEVTVTVTVTDDTKEVDTVKVNNGSAITAETNGTYKFTMPEAAANVVVTLKEKVVAPTNHNLTVTLAQATATVKVGEGEAETLTSAEAKAIAEDSVITVVVTPADGYELPETLTVDSLTATDDYTWTVGNDGKGTLVILATKFKADLAVTITATEKEPVVDDGPKTLTADDVMKAWNQYDTTANYTHGTAGTYTTADGYFTIYPKWSKDNAEYSPIEVRLISKWAVNSQNPTWTDYTPKWAIRSDTGGNKTAEYDASTDTTTDFVSNVIKFTTAKPAEVEVWFINNDAKGVALYQEHNAFAVYSEDTDAAQKEGGYVKIDAAEAGTYYVGGCSDTGDGAKIAVVKVVVTEKDEPVTTEYNITKAAATNGTVTVSAEKAAESTEVTITATPDEGYEVDTITVAKADGTGAVTVTDNKFAMPAYDVTVTVTFKAEVIEPPVVVDKTALTDAIAAATTLKDGTTYTTQADNLPGVKYWDTALKTAYETAIAEAQTVADNAEATADDVAAAVTALATATDTFKAGKTDGNKTIDDDKLDEALTEAIEAAEAAKKGVVANDATDPKKVKKGTKYVPTAVMTALESAIADAQELLDALTDEDDTNDPTKAAVTAAVAALQNATIDFKPETGTQSTGGGGGAGGSVSNTNTTKTETLADGTKRTTETAKDGTVTVTDVKPDGTKVVSTTTPDGETTVKVTVPANVDTAKVKVPVADNADTGMVAVVVKPDGTEEVIRDSIVVDGEMVFEVEDDANVKITNRAKSFVDVPGHWAENEVNFVTARDLFNGVDATHFAPDTAMTRGMMATVLFRLDGELKGDKNANFADVKEGEWYTEAVDWASDAAVITGYTDGTFAPNKAITRQELVLMVYRYAGAPAVNGKANVAKFNDADKVADWAADAMEWAIANGIINGKGNGIIDPAANATRAEVSAVLERFVKNAAQ